MLFKKKKNGPVDLKLDETQFAKMLDVKAMDVGKKYCVISQADHYNLLYRDGRFLGMPCPYGGAIYPFSLDPTKPGKNSEKKKFNAAKIVCLSNAYNLKVRWGTKDRRILVDPVTHKNYLYGANGVFYIKIEEKDAARAADKFYRKVLSQNSGDAYTNEALRDYLSDIFVPQIGSAIQKYINDNNISLTSFIGMNDLQLREVSRALCKEVVNVFDEYGLVIVEVASCESILGKMVVEPVEA
ncbi:MAG: hypothetical protein J6D87_02800 [Clostridia bacterium]|nr:hypothetical protein [Clostridia bacterium]MBQ7317018.1 hypothetical protein [Clostridia bacterium]